MLIFLLFITFVMSLSFLLNHVPISKLSNMIVENKL